MAHRLADQPERPTPPSSTPDYGVVTAVPASRIRRDRLITALAYGLAWWPLLVNRGLYWDDWTLTGRSIQDLLDAFTELGLPIGAVWYAAIFATPLPGLVGHVLIFAVYLGASLIFHAILRRIPGLTAMDALVAALAFAVLPVNYARIALIDSMYALSLLAFLAATLLLLQFVESGGIGRRVGAILLFLLSFYTASLLVLYVVPIAIAALALWRSGRRSVPREILRHLDFLVLPAAYWVAKGVLFPPNGEYAGYNALTTRGLREVPGRMISIPNQVVAEPLARAVEVAGVIGLVAGVLAAVWLVRRSRASTTVEGRQIATVALAGVGVGLIALGVFPYLAVGETPMIWDWASRHQLLVPLGVALLAAALGRGVGRLGDPGRSAGLVAVGLVLGISLIANVRTLLTYQADWFKQQALVASVRGNEVVQGARHIDMTDAATELNALRRTYRFYELNALFEVATGNTRRLVAADGKEPRPEDLGPYIERARYHMSEYVPTPVDVELIVSAGAIPGPIDLLRLVVLEAVDSTTFASEVSRLIAVEARPVGSPP